MIDVVRMAMWWVALLGSSDGDVGDCSDWLNGILRKGWLVFCGEVDKKVREEVRKALQKI